MPRAPVVFLVDVDNTLLDNDRLLADMCARVTRAEGAAGLRRFWEHVEALRAELGYADYLGALQRLRRERPYAPSLLAIADWMLDYPFERRLHPHALAVLRHLRRRGRTALLTDGDVVFQPRKVARSGLLHAVGGQVLVAVHKERELDAVARRWPARHYVLFDDKLHILAAAKAHWGARLTTVFVRQGQYAHDPAIVGANPPADLSIARIGAVLRLGTAELIAAAG
ncbi:MAG: HAD family hydrolase [bacterium]|nr:HAD family hydrolase [bacterium]